jgi:hypothetical protein
MAVTAGELSTPSTPRVRETCRRRHEHQDIALRCQPGRCLLVASMNTTARLAISVRIDGEVGLLVGMLSHAFLHGAELWT